MVPRLRALDMLKCKNCQKPLAEEKRGQRLPVAASSRNGSDFIVCPHCTYEHSYILDSYSKTITLMKVHLPGHFTA